ncbi:FidL-like protein [Sodalis sp. RH21]|uniref:FidL-like protein n=1 Tax=unclassified Sodalis (in: enterobacteria) TaxID=2636512 RepID=UPI0039B57869
MKKMTIAMALCLISITLFYLKSDRARFSGFHCSGLMVHRANSPQGGFTYTVDAKMYFTGGREGFYALNGTFAHNGQTYNLHRTRFFTFRQKNRQGLYEITITREIVSPLDNLPATVASPILLPVGESILPSFRRIDDGAILVSIFYSPFFICAKD